MIRGSFFVQKFLADNKNDTVSRIWLVSIDFGTKIGDYYDIIEL